MPRRTDWVTGYVPHRDRSIFDRTIARVRLGEEPVGYVAFKLDRQVTRTGGHLWWTKRAVPIDVVEWMDVMMPGSPAETMQDGITQVEGIVDQVKVGVWPVNHARLRGISVPGDTGTVPTLRFLEGGERDRAWREFGWGDD